MSDDRTKRVVLSNIAMMRLTGSDLAPFFAGAWPSDQHDVDVVVTLTVVDAEKAAQVAALIPEARIEIRRGQRPRRAAG